MTILEKCKQRKKEDFPDAIWLEEPTKYLYLRESNFYSCSPNYKPIKKRDKCYFCNKKIEKTCELRLIGYTKAKKSGNHLYMGTYWWLKGYDIGMPDEKIGYGCEGRWKDGKKYGITVIPSEAVKFIKKQENE